jgi:hypothetical protein
VHVFTDVEENVTLLNVYSNLIVSALEALWCGVEFFMMEGELLFMLMGLLLLCLTVIRFFKVTLCFS